MLIRISVILENNNKLICGDNNGWGILEDMLKITNDNPTYKKTIWEYKNGKIEEKDSIETQRWIEECY